MLKALCHWAGGSLEDLVGGSWCDPGVDVSIGLVGRKEQGGGGDSRDLKEPVGAA